MASPHLARANAKPVHLRALDFGGRHLLVMRQGAALSDAERVAVPVEERYVACAAWGEASSWDKRAASLVSADAEAVAAALRGRVGALSSADWRDGHKCLCSYFARSGCPGRVKHDPATVTERMQQRYLDFGATRHLLTFDLRSLPRRKFSSCRVFLRFHNPSWLVWADGTALGFSEAHNGSSDVLYRFLPGDGEAAPSALGQGATAAFALCSFANKGALSTKGENVGYGDYDVFALDPGGPLSTTPAVLNRIHVCYYYDKAEWSADREVTDAGALAELDAACEAGRYVRLLYGGRICNGIASSLGTEGMAQGGTSTAYATRVELVLRLSGAAWNR